MACSAISVATSVTISDDFSLHAPSSLLSSPMLFMACFAVAIAACATSDDIPPSPVIFIACFAIAIATVISPMLSIACFAIAVSVTRFYGHALPSASLCPSSHVRVSVAQFAIDIDRFQVPYSPPSGNTALNLPSSSFTVAVASASAVAIATFSALLRSL